MLLRFIIVVATLGLTWSNKVIHHSTDKKSDGSTECIDKDSEIPDCDHYDRLKYMIQNTKASIWSYWKIHKYPKFLSMMHIPTKSWDIQKAKFINLILNKPKNGANQTYVAGFSGSSVTAGHDNYFYEAYPNVFYETMLPIMNFIGQVDFKVFNHALGNNPCFPYLVCMDTHFGSDVDLLTWEQSMNCGRGSNCLDAFARQADAMPKKPTIIFIESTAPEWNLDHCTRHNFTSTTPRGPETMEEKKLLHQMKLGNYKQMTNATKIMHHKEYLIDSKFGDGWGVHPGDRFNPLRYIHDRFSHLAPMAMDFEWTKDYMCLGPYGVHYCEKTPGGGGGWHPGKEQHRTRGEGLAFGLLHILEDAVQSIQDSVCTLSGDTNHLTELQILKDTKGVKAEKKEHRRLGEAAVPKDLFVAPSRQSALQMLNGKTHSHPKSEPATATTPVAAAAAGAEAPKETKKKIFHSSAPKPTAATVKDSKVKSEETKQLLAKLMAKKNAAGGTGAGTGAAAAVTESAFLSLTNHTNFRQSALEILSHDHATQHHAGTAAGASGAIADVGEISGAKKPIQIPSSVIEVSGLPPLIQGKSFKLSSDTGGQCHYTDVDASADAQTKMKHLKAAALKTLQQYSRFFVQSQQKVKVMPVPEHYNHNETGVKPSCYTDYEPRTMRNMGLSSQIISKYSNWNLSLSFFDVRAVQHSIERGMGYLDRKMLHSSAGKGSQIAIKIHTNTLNFIWICQCQKGFLTYPAYMGDMIPAAEFFVLLNEQDLEKVSTGKAAVGADNSVMLDMSKFTPIEVKEFGPMCYRPNVKFPAGDHVLIIRQKEDDKKTNLGYLVTF